MTLWRCFNCHVELEKKDIKRCGHCGIVMYCSRECQKSAWKAGHKRSCQSPGQGTLSGSRQQKLLINWLNIWRGLAEEFTTRALDLANHKGEERHKTHWFESFVMIMRETNSPDVARAFRVLIAKASLCSEVDKVFPQITLFDDQPEGARVKWVIMILDPEDPGKSSCWCRTWGVNLDHFYEMEPQVSRQLAEDAQVELMHLLESGEPEEVRRRYECW